MPTGTGKTGVIGVISEFLEPRAVLLVVPWIHLRKQLTREIGSDLWKKLGLPGLRLTKNIVEFTPSSVRAVMDEEINDNTILICNIQSLQRIHDNQRDDYRDLGTKIGLVVYDEGHREPAYEWAKAVRDFHKPTVLLTATPYRNDHKMFNVVPSFVYAYTYHNAVTERYVRGVRFHQERWTGPRDFVEKLLRYYRGEFRREKPTVTRPRVIVRCENADEVKVITSLLETAGVKAVGIHDAVEGDEETLVRAVPNPSENDAVFWVHQNKLVEGIDDPSFCLLAIYKPFDNQRSLVQQIGRVTRNPGRRANQFAYVFTHSEHKQQEFWENYVEYEQVYETDLDTYERMSIYDLSAKIQPRFWYLDGKFRRSFDIESEQMHEQLRYRLSTICFIANSDFSMEKLRASVRDEWAEVDADIRKELHLDAETTVWAYVTYDNSPVLLDASYIEFRLGFTICKRIQNYVFFYDSKGMLCSYLSQAARRVDPNILQGLFSGARAHLSELSLLNSDPSAYSIRRRTFDANSIDETAPNLGDFYYVPSTSRGYTQGDRSTVRRYVGFSRARVTDSSRQDIEFRDYIEWLDRLTNELDRHPGPLLVFDRYASFTNPPGDTTPLSILIDIGDISDAFETIAETDKGRQPLEIESLYCEVTDWEFKLIANEVEYTVQIEYEKDRKRYSLRSDKFDASYVRKEGVPEEMGNSILSYLNREQSFRIVLRTSEVIYAASHFFRIKLPISGRHAQRLDLLRILKPVRKLGSIGSEKGDNVEREGWQERSLFGLIDNLGAGTEMAKEMKDFDLLVCDDLGEEVADFIAATDDNSRIVMIHAKASRTQRFVSASALQEVVGQVKKNLATLNPMGPLRPRNISKWRNPWRISGVGTVDHRIRRGEGTPEQIWTRMDSIIRDPAATREVWVVLGQAFSFQRFDELRNQPNPPPEVIQALFLILSMWQAVGEVGAKLKIFCSP